MHDVIPLKECVVEVVAREVDVRRVEGTTLEAAAQARRNQWFSSANQVAHRPYEAHACAHG